MVRHGKFERVQRTISLSVFELEIHRLWKIFHQSQGSRYDWTKDPFSQQLLDTKSVALIILNHLISTSAQIGCKCSVLLLIRHESQPNANGALSYDWLPALDNIWWRRIISSITCFCLGVGLAVQCSKLATSTAQRHAAFLEWLTNSALSKYAMHTNELHETELCVSKTSFHYKKKML